MELFPFYFLLLLSLSCRFCHAWEVFAFVLKTDASVYKHFAWSKLSTVAMAGFADADFVQFAHSKGTKVVSVANIDKEKMLDKRYRCC